MLSILPVILLLLIKINMLDKRIKSRVEHRSKVINKMLVVHRHPGLIYT